MIEAAKRNHKPRKVIIMKSIFTIHLGSPPSTPRLDEHDRVSIIHKITCHFDSFTITEGKQYAQGRFQDALLIHIATRDGHAVAELAHTLRRTFSNDSVGISHAGHYLEATEGTTVEALRQQLEEISG